MMRRILKASRAVADGAGIGDEGRGGTQRERLLAGMVAAANRGGYAGASVSAVIAEAGVSRKTFYDYFEDRNDCFVATVTGVRQTLSAEAGEAIESGPPERAGSLAIEAVVAFAVAHPAAARFLMKESLAGGSAALDARDESVRELAGLIEAAYENVPAKTELPDLPVGVTVGAVLRLLGSRLGRGERALGGLAGDLTAWLDSYARPAGKRRWQTVTPVPETGRSPLRPRAALHAPVALGPGRPRMPADAVAENHRRRIMFATSQVVSEQGYTAATVTGISKLAGVGGRVFYRHFAGKREAFSAVHELGLQYLMATAGGAFFTGKDWRERMWEGFRAATQRVQENPTMGNVGFVEAHAAGPGAIQRAGDSRIAFMIFLQEGYQNANDERAPSQLALETIITAIFELVYLQARAGEADQTGGLLALVMHLCLTPFLGVKDTERFIDGKLGS
jgi:AcrR family transcriptional regulator